MKKLFVMKFRILLLIGFSLVITNYNLATATISGTDTSKQPNEKIDTLINEVNQTKLVNVPMESKHPSKIVVMNNNDDNLWVLIGLPIFTLLLGIAIPLIIELLSKRRKSRKVLKRWVAELRCLESPIQKQIDSNEKFVREQSEKTFEIHSPTIYSILDCNIFQTMDKGELLQAIESIKKINYREAVKISNSTHGYINILTSTYYTLKDKFQRYLDEASSYISMFNDHFDDLLKAYADYGVELERETGQDPYITNATFKQITDLFSTHVLSKMETCDYNPFDLDTVFFRPLMYALSEIRFDERITPMKQHASKCVRAIKAIRMERRYVAINMQNVAEKYKVQLKDLTDIVQPLEKTNFQRKQNNL